MEKQRSSANELVKMFMQDNDLIERLKVEPIAVLSATAAIADEKTEPAYFGDKILYRVAVIVLGMLALIAAIGSLILVLNEKETPEVLVALGSAAVGALVGLFAPTPSNQSNT